MNDLITNESIVLPSISETVLPVISQLVTSLKVPRALLASDEEIKHAWKELPRELNEISENGLRGELIARMCIAVSVGLFDGAINYIWNASILQLRAKIQKYGLGVIAKTQEKNFEEKDLLELQDSALLNLCLKLNIINEEGFFYLDQCRELRNNFSAAHPTLGVINDREFILFLNRCVRYALADSSSPEGVDINEFISAIKNDKFNTNQHEVWVERINKTHDAQREMLIELFHGIYCDSNSSESARLNVFQLCNDIKDNFSANMKLILLNQHSGYVASGKEDKHKASKQFFQKLSLLSLLNDSEKSSLFSKSISRLWAVHTEMNNFYNEPPFAEQLMDLSKQVAIPESVKSEFVKTVVCCRIGNGYGVSRAATGTYEEMIKNFSPKEIAIMIELAMNESNPLGRRIHNVSKCKAVFGSILDLIDQDSIPNAVKTNYGKLKSICNVS